MSEVTIATVAEPSTAGGYSVSGLLLLQGGVAQGSGRSSLLPQVPQRLGCAGGLHQSCLLGNRGPPRASEIPNQPRVQTTIGRGGKARGAVTWT